MLYLKMNLEEDNTKGNKFYKDTVVLVLLYASEIWVVCTKGERHAQMAKMNVFRIRIKIRENLRIFPINEKIQENRSKLKQQLNRMGHKLLKVVLLL